MARNTNHLGFGFRVYRVQGLRFTGFKLYLGFIGFII